MAGIDEAKRGAGHDRKRKRVAIKRHTPQQEQNAERPAGEGECKAGGERHPHEAEALERGDQQVVERERHAARAANANLSSVSVAAVSPQAMGFRASSKA